MTHSNARPRTVAAPSPRDVRGMSTSPAVRQALEAVIARARTDAEFRQWLLTDPRAAIQDEFGVAIPNHVRIKFIERYPGVDALIVLPDFRRPSDAAAASSQDSLELEGE